MKNNTQKTITSALAELGAELGISEADFGGKVKIEGKDPVVASRHHLGESTSILLALFGMEPAGHRVQRACAGWMKRLNSSWSNAGRMFRLPTAGCPTMWGPGFDLTKTEVLVNLV